MSCFETPSIEQLSRIIGSAAAPAFLLGAVAAFISVLISRNEPGDRPFVIPPRHRRWRSGQIIHQGGYSRLKRRAALLNRSIFYATVSAIITG
jgi:hypothetical protein